MKKILTLILLIPAYGIAAPVNINEADAETISQALTGVGPKKAEAIVEYRNKNGSFKALGDLEKVSGIGEKTIKANEKDILLSNDKFEKNPANAKDVLVSDKPKKDK